MQDGYLISHILLWILLLLQTLIIYFLLKLVVQFLNRFRLEDKKVEIPSLVLGQRAPLFREKDQHGRTIALAESNGYLTLLFFVQDTCGTCKSIIPHINKLLQFDHNLKIIMIAGRISLQDTMEVPEGIPLIRSNDLFSSYYVTKAPTAVLVGPAGEVIEIHEITEFEQLLAMLDRQSAQVS
ncbi:TlpA family protein disulfide reductase [Brevibacillus sp. SYSU BS000544]|uniref:TlpA family protein disulfide reductase n=1 Tax=Brevibacillus sp. SYSU BS000544 TaxID=3416443 RepID=UPI003CE4CDBE